MARNFASQAPAPVDTAWSLAGYIKCEIATAKIVRTNVSANNKGTNGASEGSRLMGRQRWLTEGCSLFALTTKEARRGVTTGLLARSKRLMRRD
jgi:hypothetical protein